MLHRAIEMDPDYALATALAAWGHAQLVVHNATPSPGEEKKRALQLAERAGILDLDDPQVLTARCAVHTVAGQFDVAGTLIGRALAVDPLSGWAWERSGWLKTFSGQPEAGLAHLGRAIHLDPSCPSNANRLVGFGCAYFDAGRYEDAAFWLRRALQEQPSTVWANRSLCVSYARLGERLAGLELARRSATVLSRLDHRPSARLAPLYAGLHGPDRGGAERSRIASVRAAVPHGDSLRRQKAAAIGWSNLSNTEHSIGMAGSHTPFEESGDLGQLVHEPLRGNIGSPQAVENWKKSLSVWLRQSAWQTLRSRHLDRAYRRSHRAKRHADALA